ncbi:MAG: DUF4258 domain-containing protein [Defluviitaleaceae bacterium]|nr:DUF4258 domain-containing protein [Defluviitaleaceae bacterium]
MLDKINIHDLQLLLSVDKDVWTEHSMLRLRERSIKRADVVACIMNGEIIEQYPSAYPHPACLVLALIKDNPIHVVAGIGGGNLSIITVYYPTLDKWERDYKTRKAGV